MTASQRTRPRSVPGQGEGRAPRGARPSQRQVRPSSPRRESPRRSATAAGERGSLCPCWYGGWNSLLSSCIDLLGERLSEHLQTLALGGDGRIVETEIGTGRKRPPRVR